MYLYGANPDELDHLGTTLQRQIDAVQGVISTVSGVLASTTWMGPGATIAFRPSGKAPSRAPSSGSTKPSRLPAGTASSAAPPCAR